LHNLEALQQLRNHADPLPTDVRRIYTIAGKSRRQVSEADLTRLAAQVREENEGWAGYERRGLAAKRTRRVRPVMKPAAKLEAALRGLHDALAEHKRFVQKNERIGTALRVAREALELSLDRDRR